LCKPLQIILGWDAVKQGECGIPRGCNHPVRALIIGKIMGESNQGIGVGWADGAIDRATYAIIVDLKKLNFDLSPKVPPALLESLV
jgi:hypothetical protein